KDVELIQQDISVQPDVEYPAVLAASDRSLRPERRFSKVQPQFVLARFYRDVVAEITVALCLVDGRILGAREILPGSLLHIPACEECVLPPRISLAIDVPVLLKPAKNPDL